MNKRQKQVQEQLLNNEAAVIKRLKQVYNQSLKDITQKAQELQMQIVGLQEALETVEDAAERKRMKSMIQSKVYQKQYQDALKKQISSILDNLHVEEFKSVSAYLQKCYEDGFVGTLYDLQGQGIPLLFPLNQEAMVKAVQLDSKISEGLYTRLGEDVATLKKKITAQVSRGIAMGLTYQQVAQQLAGHTRIWYNNAVRISRTEGHRIQNQSAMDACYKAKDKGADVVKQWDSTLDGKTRPSHQQVDGEIRELDEKFSNGLMFPGDPSGGAAEVVNCRCALLQRARWALDEDELETLKERAAYFGLDKTDNFEDYKKKYLTAIEKSENGATMKEYKPASPPKKRLQYRQFENGQAVNDFFYYDDEKRGVLAKKNSQYGKWLNNLENGTQPVIADYCADAYDDINKYWRKIGDWKNIDADKVKYQTDLIDKAISTFNLKDNIQTYRGTDLDTIIQLFPDAEELSDLVGQSFSDNAFVSTSPVRSVAEKFASQNGQDGVLLQLFVPSGIGRGAYINQLSGFQDDEFEFLLKRNARFEVVEVDTSGGMPIVKGRWIE